MTRMIEIDIVVVKKHSMRLVECYNSIAYRQGDHLSAGLSFIGSLGYSDRRYCACFDMLRTHIPFHGHSFHYLRASIGRI